MLFVACGALWECSNILKTQHVFGNTIVEFWVANDLLKNKTQLLALILLNRTIKWCLTWIWKFIALHQGSGKKIVNVPKDKNGDF